MNFRKVPKRRYLRVMVAIAASATVASVSGAQVVKRSGVSGTIQTIFARGAGEIGSTGPHPEVVFFTVPSGGVFTVKQVCASATSGQVLARPPGLPVTPGSDGGMSGWSLSPRQEDGLCVDYFGLVLPAGTELVIDASADRTVTVTAVVSEN